MEKLKSLVLQYKVHILIGLVVIMFFRGCSKSRSISRLEKQEIANIEKIDSLTNVVDIQDGLIKSFPQVLRDEKLSVYLGLDDKISRMDRKPQMMRLHATIKDSILVLKK